jgi:hypothetical protein
MHANHAIEANFLKNRRKHVLTNEEMGFLGDILDT